MPGLYASMVLGAKIFDGCQFGLETWLLNPRWMPSDHVFY